MKLTIDQLKLYQDKGYLFLKECFSKDEIQRLKSELPTVYNHARHTAESVVEADGKNVRMVFNAHTKNAAFQSLAHHPRIVQPVTQILKSSVYVHQHSINAKLALEGDVFKWHQDYTYHREKDGIKHPNLVVTMVFLDDVNEFNGPLMLIPCSHKDTSIDVFENEETFHIHQSEGVPSQSEGDQFNLEVSQATLERLVSEHGIVAPKGNAGSVIFFHPNCVHGSGANMYPFNRTVVVSVYNSIDNLPIAIEDPRPEFLSSRNYAPISPVSDDALLV